MKMKSEETIMTEVLIELEPKMAQNDIKYINTLIDGKVERMYNLAEMKKAIRLAFSKTKEGRI